MPPERLSSSSRVPSQQEETSDLSQRESSHDDDPAEQFDQLAEEITNRILALWRKELRRDRERLGHKPRR